MQQVSDERQFIRLYAGKLGLFVSIVLLGLGLSACKDKEAAVPAQAPKVEVGVHVVTAEDILLTTELPGRTAPYNTAEIRPQVNGILQKRLFTEGGVVKQGQVLYQIDPAPYQANVTRAEAAYESAKLLYERYKELLESDAISKQQYDDAHAQYLQTKANLEAAQIDLGYTRLTAPITGRIGRSSVTQGALLTAYQPNVMATIQQLDPIYVDIPQSSAVLLQLQDDLAEGRLTTDGKNQVEVKLQLENGKAYSHSGKLQFSEVTVDESSNTVTLRAIFPNPDGKLLPGMFVRAQLKEGIRANAVLVPQRAVTRDNTGQAIVMAVDNQGTVSARRIVTGRTIGNQWLVEDGLKAGEQVVVEGLQRVKPGMSVKTAVVNAAVEANTAATASEASVQADAAKQAEPIKAAIDAAEKAGK